MGTDRVGEQGKVQAGGGLQAPKEEGVFNDMQVEVAVPEQPQATRHNSGGLFHAVGIFLRETVENMGFLKPDFPCLDNFSGDEAKLKAIGHYMQRCSSLGIEPEFPTVLPELNIDTESKDVEVQLAEIAIDYFKDKEEDQNERLIKRPGRLFVDVAKAYLKDKSEFAVSSGIDNYVLECVNDSELKMSGTKPLTGVSEKSGLAPADVIAMRLLGKGLEDAESLSLDEKLFVARFLNKVPGNMKLNKALRGLKSKDLERMGISEDVAKKLGRLSFKTREQKAYSVAFEKLKNLEYYAEKSEAPPDRYRLSLHEAIVLEEFGQVADIMEEFNAVVSSAADEDAMKGVANEAKKTGSISSKMQTGKIMSDNLKVKLAESLNLQPGDIIQNIGKKFLSMQGSQASRAEQVRYLASIYRHSGKVCMVNGKLSVSDVWAKYRNYEMGFTDLVTSDFFRIDATKLIQDPRVAGRLQSKYGDNWMEKVNEMYREIEQELHAVDPAKKYTKIKNTRDLQAKIGLTYLFKGLHKRSSDREYSGLHAKIIEDKYSEKHTPMVCSVFAAKMTVAALYELNERLKTELGTKKDVIEMPFGPREKMHNINPDRFTAILEEAGCLERVQGRETFEQYFDLDPVHGVGDVHTV